MTQEITSEDVAAWMQIQLAKAHERHEYANITVQLNSYKDGGPSRAKFQIYHAPDLQSPLKNSIEECFDEISGTTPAVTAAKKRAEAAKLMEEADKMEKEGTI